MHVYTWAHAYVRAVCVISRALDSSHIAVLMISVTATTFCSYIIGPHSKPRILKVQCQTSSDYWTQQSGISALVDINHYFRKFDDDFCNPFNGVFTAKVLNSELGSQR